jgi:hypothetical protein
MPLERIPAFQRFQWLNSPKVVALLAAFLRPPERGRKGYGKVLLFRWLVWKQVMRCTYRDLESVSGIDHSTFVKFRKRLMASFFLPGIFAALSHMLVAERESLRPILDSSFVETYSKHDGEGSEYSGYKQANGFKLHSPIGFEARLPLLQIATGGARAGVTTAREPIGRAPPDWNVRSLAADKGYDSEAFVQEIKRKWDEAKVAIPLRKTNQEKVAGHPEGWLNRFMKSLPRSWSPALRKSRTEIERYFSRKKHVFRLGEEKARGLRSFEANCCLTSIMEHLEYAAKLVSLFTRLPCSETLPRSRSLIEALTRRALRLHRGLHTPLHTRYVRAPLYADGRNPIRGFTDWLPTAVGLAPDWRGFLTAMDLVLSYRRPFDQTTPVGRNRPRYSAFPTAVGGLVFEGPTLRVTTG